MDEARFWANVAIGKPDECWPWLAGTTNGYGNFRLNGRAIIASRYVLESKGVDLTGKFACHTCDNPPCCNPAHLWAGTLAENNRDCIAKGRWGLWRGSEPGKNGFAKLTNEDIPRIRRMRKNGMTNVGIAKVFDITPSAISDIIRGRRWAHVP